MNPAMLSRRKHYLQIALNSTLDEAKEIIDQLPIDERIILEAGTPLLKTYGEEGIRRIRHWWQQRIFSEIHGLSRPAPRGRIFIDYGLKDLLTTRTNPQPATTPHRSISSSYVVADYKAMDRGATEVKIAHRAGASAITVLGSAPIETIDVLIEACEKQKLDAIIDMMNVDQPYKVLRRLKKLPSVVMLHRGVDETELGQTRFPIHQINKIKGSYNVMVSVGGGDTIREVQSAVFNGADIVMVWKEFYHSTDHTGRLAEEFLRVIK